MSVVGLRGISDILSSPLPLYKVAPRGGNMVQGRDTCLDPGSRLGFAASSLTEQPLTFRFFHCQMNIIARLGVKQEFFIHLINVY